jgi:hypothetical protein
MRTRRICLFLFVFSSIAFAKETEIGDKRNRISMNFDPLVPWILLGHGHPSELRYDRLIQYNASISGLAYYDLFGNLNYGLIEYAFGIGIKKYFWGQFQRFSIGPQFLYHTSGSGVTKTETYFAPLILGYTWQWNHLSLGAEAGSGPSLYDVGGKLEKWGAGIQFGLYMGVIF